MTKLSEIEWEGVWAVLASTAAVVVFTIIVIALTADHRVKNYYLDAGAVNGTCVRAARNWASDTTVYCSDDPAKTLAVMKGANEALRAK